MMLTDAPIPEASEDEVLVRVNAVSLGFPDVLMVRGTYQTQHDLPFTPCSEVCGEIDGQRVVALSLRGIGALAQYIVTDPKYVYSAPGSLTDGEAATLPAAFMTAWFGLHNGARIQPGETLVVTAAAGGVGGAAVQLGRTAGARVIGLTRGTAKAETAGGKVQTARLNRPLLRGFSLVGVNTSLHLAREPDAARAMMEEVAKLCDAGLVKPYISATVGMADAAKQLERIGTGLTAGRVIVDPWRDTEAQLKE
jgi:NADPH:quinone reductase-like Zn-dependent oxidoreductase